MVDTSKIVTSIENLVKSSYNEGKRDGAKESKDIRRKKLGRSVDTVAKARESGKEVSFKQIKSAFSALDDDRNNFAKAKSLLEKSMSYFDLIPVPEGKTKSKPQLNTANDPAD